MHVVGDSGHDYHGEKNGCREVLRRFAPGIPMKEAAQPGVGNHDRVRRRLPLDRAAIRRILFQGVVNAVLVAVAHIISDQPAKMLLVQRDDMAEDDVSMRGSFGKRFAQLPDNPLRGRVSRCVEVQHLASPMFAHQEAFASFTTAANSPKIPGYAPFRDDQAELLKLSVDLGGSPVWVLFRQASDQTADLPGHLRPARGTTRPPAPVQPKTRAMPAGDGLWFHDGKDVSPASPKVA